MAAREIGRPVKLVLTRAQTFTSNGYQPATEQRIVLSATRDGRLTALEHRSWSGTAMLEDYVEGCCQPSRSLYAVSAIRTATRAVRVNRGTPTPMRAPHGTPAKLP